MDEYDAPEHDHAECIQKTDAMERAVLGLLEEHATPCQLGFTPEGSFPARFVLVSEWLNHEGKRTLVLENGGELAPWEQIGFLQYAIGVLQ